MLTLYVLPSGTKDKWVADSNKTIESFKGLATEIKIFDRFSSFTKISMEEKQNEWFCIMYNDERIDDNLREALPIFFKECKADILVAYKMVSELSSSVKYLKSPRFFRKHVKLKRESLLPEDETLIFETILDGWIKSHVPF